jgi:hypothetical protein
MNIWLLLNDHSNSIVYRQEYGLDKSVKAMYMLACGESSFEDALPIDLEAYGA